MTILAIDPSDTRHAWALMDGTTIAPRLRQHGRDIAQERDAIATRPDLVACEMVACYGMAAGATLFDTAVMIGRLLQQYHNERIPFRRIIRPEVKLIVCGQSRAKDGNVRQAIIDRFGGPASTKKGGPLHKVAGDTWAAIAVGLAALHPEVRWYVPAAERVADLPVEA